MPDRAILVLHGLSMCGASMRRNMGALAARLESLGFTLVAPNGSHRLTSDELAGLLEYFEDTYGKVGQRAREAFRSGRLWDDEEHYDWLQSSTDAATGKKSYGAVEQSLEAIASALRGRELAGVLGFSQGAAMATIVAALALGGDARFGRPEWGVFLSGFNPKPDHPKLVTYPIRGKLRTLHAIGDRDPCFPGTAEYLKTLSEAFEDPRRETCLMHGHSHDLPKRPEDVDRIVRFVSAGSNPGD